MTFEWVEVERRGDVAVIRLNDPAALNAITLQMIDELRQALAQAAATRRAIVLTGSGRAFCAGAKLSGGVGPGEGSDLGQGLETHYNPLMMQLRDLPVPWITAVRGAAAGFGASLALAADMVVATEKAYFLQAFVALGLVPDGGATHLLVRAVGRVRAMEMMLLGERIGATQALEWGLVNRVTADADLEAVAFGLAERLAAGPTRTLGMIRRLAWQALDNDWQSSLQAEREFQKEAGRTSDAVEGVSAFVGKRASAFTGV